MSKRHQVATGCYRTLGTLVICFSSWGLMTKATEASPDFPNANFKLAQISIQGPTPLNLRPRVHIPSPPSNHSRYRRRHHYSSSHEPWSNGRIYRQDRHRDEHYGHYDEDYHYDDHDHHRHNHGRYHHGSRKRRGPVIIINPNGSSIYKNNGSFIRVIHK